MLRHLAPSATELHDSVKPLPEAAKRSGRIAVEDGKRLSDLHLVPALPNSRPRLLSPRSYARLRPIIFVFLPFAAGYYLSYLFRTINALISAQLTADLSLNASQLGLLTSVYFLTFAAAQLPLGIALDRYGPRRIQGVLLLIAAAGATLFGAATSFPALVAGRALIGLGVSGCLIAGLKAIVVWFPKERLPVLNGCFIMLGTLGAVTATVPADLLLPWLGWRGLCEALALITATCALTIYAITPDAPPTVAGHTRAGFSDLKRIYTDRCFWRLAPLSTACISTAWALQGLWVGPWLVDVESLDRPHVVRHLFVMGLALSAAAALLGIVAGRLHMRGNRFQSILAVVAALFVAAQLALVLRLPISSYLLWVVIAGVGAATVLSYAILADCFPSEIAGQANAALNVLHIGGAFVLQCAIGFLIACWATHDGHYPPIAYQTTFALILLMQFLALAWFVRPPVREERESLGKAGVSGAISAMAGQPSTADLDRSAQLSRIVHLRAWMGRLRRPAAERA